MIKEKKISNLEDFFKEYKEKNSILILLYVLISFTLYVIYWLYKMNLDLLKVDEDAPNNNRAISVLVILPSLWFLICYFFKKFIFHLNSNYLLKIAFSSNLYHFSFFNFSIGFIEFFGWLLIIFLILKYFYDFSVSFGKVTKSQAMVWYVFLSSEVFGFIFILFGIKLLLILSFFTIISVPAMQEKMNFEAHKYKILSQKKLDYEYGSNN